MTASTASPGPRATTTNLGHPSGNEAHSGKQADSTLRWGGLAGILGSILMLLTFGIVAAFVGMEPMGAQAVMRSPNIRPARTVENGLNLVVFLWVIHFLALHPRCVERARRPRCSGPS